MMRQKKLTCLLMLYISCTSTLSYSAETAFQPNSSQGLQKKIKNLGANLKIFIKQRSTCNPLTDRDLISMTEKIYQHISRQQTEAKEANISPWFLDRSQNPLHIDQPQSGSLPGAALPGAANSQETPPSDQNISEKKLSEKVGERLKKLVVCCICSTEEQETEEDSKWEAALNSTNYNSEESDHNSEESDHNSEEIAKILFIESPEPSELDETEEDFPWPSNESSQIAICTGSLSAQETPPNSGHDRLSLVCSIISSEDGETWLRSLSPAEPEDLDTPANTRTETEDKKTWLRLLGPKEAERSYKRGETMRGLTQFEQIGIDLAQHIARDYPAPHSQQKNDHNLDFWVQ